MRRNAQFVFLLEMGGLHFGEVAERTFRHSVANSCARADDFQPGQMARALGSAERTIAHGRGIGPPR